MKISKKLSYILRHNPDQYNIVLDEWGYGSIEALCHALMINAIELNSVITCDSKRRYSYSPDGKKIKANQGHSIKIDHQFEAIKPPKYLYHGSSMKSNSDILKSGINKMNRHHVHLSQDAITAKAVGKRHGEPIVYTIDTEKMYADGFKFFESKNFVWLTDNIPMRYISSIARG